MSEADEYLAHLRSLEGTARLLPTELAELLSTQSAASQEMALALIQTCVEYWEEHGIILDPVTFDVIVGSVGVALVNYGEALSMVADQLAIQTAVSQTLLSVMEKEIDAQPDPG